MKHFSAPKLFKRLRPASISSLYKTRLGLAAFLFVCSLLLILPTAFLSGGAVQGQKGDPVKVPEQRSKLVPYSSQAVGFAESPAVRDIQPRVLTPEEMEKFKIRSERQEKNSSNRRNFKPVSDPGKGSPFTDLAINNSKVKETEIKAVTNPLQNFDGPDADTGQPLYGTRFATP